MVNAVGIIHARGGSRRIPMKNIRPLAGVPLVAYMIKAALASRHLRRVIVSTDHPEIKRISLEHGAEVPFTRPAELAGDCPSEWVTKHAVEFVEKEESGHIDVAVTMQPTTPLCLASDIDACIDILLKRKDLDSVFSVKPIQERPEWMFGKKDDYRAELLMGGDLKGERNVSQSLPSLFIPNGAVYATRRDALFREDTIICCENTGVHVMPLERSIDIDEPIDFEVAEFLMSKMKERGAVKTR